MTDELLQVQALAERLINNLEKVIVGKRETVEEAVVGLLCRGHLLIDDVPGVGKTMLARSLAKSIGCDFSRIQFTPDMLPSDVTGISIFNQVSREFEFKPGPIFSNIILADEINRATPKTQSALLEAMEERQITVDGFSHILDEPFMVIATQNPIEYEGTFPLPEAELDRFLMKIRLGYPSVLDEIRVISDQQIQHPILTLQAVVEADEFLKAQAAIRTVYVAPSMKRYIVEIMRSTREHPDIYLGASPRGSLGLFRVSQAMATLQGRDYVIPDDVKSLAEMVLAHRMVIQPAARLQNVTAGQIVQELVNSVPIPVGEVKGKIEV